MLGLFKVNLDICLLFLSILVNFEDIEYCIYFYNGLGLEIK